MKIAHAIYAGCSVGLLFGLSAGCKDTSTKVAPKSSLNKSDTVITNWAEVLGKSPATGSCRDFLARFHGTWSEASRKQLAESTAAAQARLSEVMPLSANDINEYQSLEFTSTDAVFLEEAAFLRDVEKNVNWKALPAKQRALVAWKWTARNIYLRPATERDVPIPAPAHLGLVAGVGQPIDRISAYLALASMLEVPAYVLARKGTENQPLIVAENRNPQPAEVWAIAVRIDDQFLLLNPLSDTTWNNTNGDSLTLSDVLAEPKLAEAIAKTLSENKSLGFKAWDKGEVAQSSLLAVPTLAGLTMRMKLLAKELPDYGLYQPLEEEKKQSEPAFARVKRSWQVWSSKEETLTFPRLLRLGVLNPQLFQSARERFIPWEGMPKVFTRLANPEPLALLAQLFGTDFVKLRFTAVENSTIDPPVEIYFRGSTNECINQFQKLRADAEQERANLAGNLKLEQGAFAWCEEANKSYANLARARRANDAAALAIAQGEVDRLRSTAGAPVQLMNRTVKTLYIKECLYYIAQAVHEKAFRLQVRLAMDPKAVSPGRLQDAWKESIDWWDRYLAYSIGAVEIRNTARDSHAEQLLQEAKLALKQAGGGPSP